MNEITRFFQVRSVQKFSKEEKEQIGLQLLSEEELSPLAAQLQDAGCNDDFRQQHIYHFHQQFVGNQNTTLSNPIIQHTYDWLDYKSKSIKKEEFESFIKTTIEPLGSNIAFPTVADRFNIADHYIYSFHTNEALIDFDLAVRSYYLITQCVENTNGVLTVTAGEDLMNTIMNLPIILPVKALKTRCCKDSSVPDQQPHMPVGQQPEGVIHVDDPNFQQVIGSQANESMPISSIVEDECNCGCNDECVDPSNYCICIQPYVADLMMVKEELVAYEEGDIAYIENVLAGENKSRTHRNLFRTEDYSEREEEVNTSEEKDLQVTEKFTLQSEVEKTVSTDLSMDAGITYSNKFGKAIEVTAHANVAGKYSKSKSESIARSYARDVIDRSVSKISEKVRTLTSSRIISETEETNVHAIENTSGDHRAGIYYWVNKVSKAQLFNYGKRMMIDLYVPEPAALYKRLVELRNQSISLKEKQRKPELKLTDITEDNYTDKLKEYDVAEMQVPPEPFMNLQLSFQHNVTEPQKGTLTGFSENFKFDRVPEGYKASKLEYHINCASGHPKNTDSESGDEKDEFSIMINVANQNIMNENYNQRTADSKDKVNKEMEVCSTIEIEDEEYLIDGVLSFAYSGYATMGLAMSGAATLHCVLSETALEEWKLSIYNLVMDDYQRKLEAYNTQLSQKEELFQIKGRNPFLNREIERNELKRHVIAILMCNYFNGIGSMNEKVKECGYPEFDFEKLSQDAPLIRFFEQVFEWNHVLYLFYHSMWARKCKWPELINEDSGDPLFDRFLEAGASRVQVPVREGMEEVFACYLATGKIWSESGVPPVSGQDGFVSAIQEIIEARQGDYSQRSGTVEATNGSDQVILSGSTQYWDLVNSRIHSLNIENDTDRELLLDTSIYRIKQIKQNDPMDDSTWLITLDRSFEGDSSTDLKHAVGAKFVGAPWEIKIPTKLVYFQNESDQLPKYPLN